MIDGLIISKESDGAIRFSGYIKEVEVADRDKLKYCAANSVSIVEWLKALESVCNSIENSKDAEHRLKVYHYGL